VVDEAAVAAVPPLGLPGAHQRRNAAAAIAAVNALGLPVVAAALAQVRHPGRFEVIGAPPVSPGQVSAVPVGVPYVILDGAHNPHGAAALADAIRERGDQPVLVVAASADKDVAGIAAALVPVVGAVIATRYQQDRAMDPVELAAVFAHARSAAGAGELAITAAPDLRSAVAAAASFGRPVLIAGSLFLIGEARTWLLGAPTDPMLVTDPPAR
jgi:dihydrofolate synthase/folylpolyglutamate synthase